MITVLSRLMTMLGSLQGTGDRAESTPVYTFVMMDPVQSKTRQASAN